MAVKNGEQKIDDKLEGKEIIGWNREAQNGKGQGTKSKNEDANVLGGGRNEIKSVRSGNRRKKRKEGTDPDMKERSRIKWKVISEGNQRMEQRC